MAKDLDIKSIRNKASMNQDCWWKRFGVTQSGASRYENGRNMPMPLKLLIELRLSGAITDEQLMMAKKKVLAKDKKK